MGDVQVQHGAGPWLARPGEERLAVGLDQPDAAVDEFDAVAPEILPHLAEEVRQPGARDVELRDHLGRGGCAEAPVDVAVVVVDVGAQLVLVRPVYLPVGGEVVIAIELEGAPLVGVSEVEELAPIVDVELALPGGDRRRVGHRPVAGEDPRTQEAVRVGLGRVLEVAVLEALGDAARERVRDRPHLPHLDDAPDLVPGREPQADRGDDAEEPVPPDHEPEELGVRLPAACPRCAGRVHHGERLDVLDDRPVAQPASVHVRGERPADREPVGAGLLLHDAPLPVPALLHADELVDQLRPLDARLEVDHAVLSVEGQHPPHAAHVEQHRVLAELLPAHRVTSARDADGAAVAPRGADHLLHLGGRRRLHERVHPRPVELRVDVVHLGRWTCRGGPTRGASADRERAHAGEDLPSCQHHVLRSSARAHQ